MRRNLSSSLKTRWRQSSMSDFDRLPPEARAWLREAKLPWSTSSVLRIWSTSRSPDQALVRLTQAEAARLAKDRFIPPQPNR